LAALATALYTYREVQATHDTLRVETLMALEAEGLIFPDARANHSVRAAADRQVVYRLMTKMVLTRFPEPRRLA
jgi:hypothetical protein